MAVDKLLLKSFMTARPDLGTKCWISVWGENLGHVDKHPSSTNKKSLKIPNGYSEAVNRRMIENINGQKKKNKKTYNTTQNVFFYVKLMFRRGKQLLLHKLYPSWNPCKISSDKSYSVTNHERKKEGGDCEVLRQTEPIIRHLWHRYLVERKKKDQYKRIKSKIPYHRKNTKT